MSGENPTFIDTYMTLFRRFMAEEIQTSFIGEVIKYENQKAEIKPIIERHYKDGTKLSFKNVSNVPVLMPGTSDCLIKLPVKKGDKVLCICTKASIDEWLAGGTTTIQSIPRQFSMSDAIAIPGMVTIDGGSIGNNNDDFEIIYKDASIVIEESGTVNINNGNLTIDV